MRPIRVLSLYLASATLLSIFTFAATPSVRITELRPASGAVGVTIEIRGSGFDFSSPSNNRVVFTGRSGGEVNAAVVSATATSVKTVVPAGTVSGKVYVQVKTQQSNPVRFKLEVNAAPKVNAGPDQSMTLSTATGAAVTGTATGASTMMAGTATDDGLPASTLNSVWSFVAGPAPVSFGDTKSLNTSVGFSAAGRYTLRLTASDNALSSTDDVSITVNTPAPVNSAPTVRAGADQSITLPAAANLMGTATDDGLPGGALVASWTKTSGPGTVTFANTSSLSTTANFSTSGTYTLALNVTDGSLGSSDSLVVNVAAAPSSSPTPTPPPISPLPSPTIGGIPIFPGNNVWNTPVDSLPAQRAIDVIKDHGGHNFHPDFGSMWNGLFNGIPVNVVSGSTTPVRVNITSYAAESDMLPGGDQHSGFLPIPADAAIEGDPVSAPAWEAGGDHHLLLIDSDTQTLHELYNAIRQSDGSIVAKQYSRWDLKSNALRPDFLTTTDAAGLPVVPGLVRYDQVAACLAIDPMGTSCTLGHALRFTLDLTHGPHIWPARHDADSGNPDNPPFGLRVRLKSSVDTSPYSPTNRIILNTLKKYGALLTDNGGDWFFQGSPDPRWNDDDLHLLIQITPADAFEVVDTSKWIVDADSGQADPAGSGLPVVTWPKPGAILAVDFDDPSNIETAPGFRSFSTGPYSSSLGYGWQSTSGLGWRTRFSSSDPLWKDIVITEFPSAQSYRMDLPNGAYSVTLFLGDPENSNNNGLSVSAEGATQFTLLNTAQGQRLAKTFPVTVSDGQLNITFGPTTPGGLLALAGLEIHPATAATGPSTPPLPSLTLSASPQLVAVGQSSTVSWSSLNATSCLASGAWSGPKPTSGSEPQYIAALGTYTLMCAGEGGSVSQSVTITPVAVASNPTGGTLHVDTSGTGLNQTVTVESVGVFRLVFEAADNWGLSQWYDLLHDPSAQTNLIGPATGGGTDLTTSEPGLFQQVFYGTVANDPKLYTRAAYYYFPTSERSFQLIEDTPDRVVVQATSHPVVNAVGVLDNITGKVRYTIYPNGRIYVHSEMTAKSPQTISTWHNSIIGLQNPGGTGTAPPDKAGWIRASSTQNPYSYVGGKERYVFSYWSPVTPAPYTDWAKASILLVPAATNPFQGKQIIHSWNNFIRWGYGVENLSMAAGQTIAQDYLIQLGTKGSTILPDIWNSSVADPIANSYLASPIP